MMEIVCGHVHVKTILTSLMRRVMYENIQTIKHKDLRVFLLDNKYT